MAAWLSDEERERWQRFHFARDRDRFLVARGLVRGTLSRYLPRIAEGEWRFDANEYGRPFLAEEQQQGPSPLYFNLSHTQGLVAMAVARCAEVGVDVEPVDRDGPYLSMADHFFAPSEAEGLRSLDGGEPAHQRRFLELWTLKESYIKARGMGLSLALDSFAFQFERPGAVGFRTWPSAGDTGEDWSFASGCVGSTHRLALALRDGPQEDALSVRLAQLGEGGEWGAPALQLDRHSCARVQLLPMEEADASSGV